MNQSGQETRYIGRDINKRYTVIDGVNREPVVFKPQKVSYYGWRYWLSQHLRPTDEVVIEATGNSRQMEDELKLLVERVVVAHARIIKLILANRWLDPLPSPARRFM